MDYSSGSESTWLERRISLVQMRLNMQTKSKDYFNNVRRFEVYFFSVEHPAQCQSSPSCSIAMVTLTSGQSIILTTKTFAISQSQIRWVLAVELRDGRIQRKRELGDCSGLLCLLVFFRLFHSFCSLCFLFLRPPPLPPCY